MLENPVLELIESTHMGNGSLWLLEMDGRELRLLLQVRVSGRCWSDEPGFGIPPHGEARFEGAGLKVEYLQANGKETTVKLAGSLAITDMEGNAKPSCGYQQLCVWNGEKRIFETGRPHKVDR
ncbi:hypothetical protein JIN84_04365 [Luteolibacter yonseiensis]|uniref:Uncharacterized protein n=1 Tax=Luteolibacter yonseiensis TaxID=1144680 RepID=A0A934VA67_9BACT|nr:hypothetical protein [Luteolibacter yonseiensis]MBK1814835.1 hypothetical protein [Luteolibacter yonseiensis]